MNKEAADAIHKRILNGIFGVTEELNFDERERKKYSEMETILQTRLNSLDRQREIIKVLRQK